MTPDPRTPDPAPPLTLALLPSVKDPPDRWDAVTPLLEPTFPVLRPSLGLSEPGAGPFTLERGAATVTAALDAAAVPSAAICGIGLGAMIALQLGATHPDRVSHLVLVTRQVALSPLLLSLPAVVVRLLPATAVRRLGAGQPQLLALLDQVRPVDATPLATQVPTRCLVLCGARDRLNRRASESLARALPDAELRLLPTATSTWSSSSPSLLADALTTFLTT